MYRSMLTLLVVLAAALVGGCASPTGVFLPVPVLVVSRAETPQADLAPQPDAAPQSYSPSQADSASQLEPASQSEPSSQPARDSGSVPALALAAEPHATASPPARHTTGSRPVITLLTPTRGVRVGQFAAIRYAIRGTVPEGAYAVVLVRDGTGLETNWWIQSETPVANPGGSGSGGTVFESDAQFGELDDANKTFAIKILLFRQRPDLTTNPGPLPTGALAASATVEVVRE